MHSGVPTYSPNAGETLSTSHSLQSTSDALDALERHVKRTGLRMTRQRRIIAEVIMSLEGHVNIEELYDAVRQQDKNVGYATLYRTLKLLREVGIVSATQFGEGPARYESNVARDHHDHLVCQRCGLIIEFENDEIERLQLEVAQHHGMRLTDHTMELYGVCDDRAACDRRRLA